jgi:hypothetical protein
MVWADASSSPSCKTTAAQSAQSAFLEPTARAGSSRKKAQRAQRESGFLVILAPFVLACGSSAFAFLDFIFWMPFSFVPTPLSTTGRVRHQRRWPNGPLLDNPTPTV